MPTNEEIPPKSQETESLVKRLAGPSSGKAGFVSPASTSQYLPNSSDPELRLAKDQSEINRIISDASKGSKFYENEKKKDKELTLRIDKILKQKDEALKGADIAKAEAAVDHLISQLDSQRDLTQIIVHVDMDAFYASVELLDNPELKGKPFAVGKGVLTTASYEARKFGVRSGMAGFIAKKLCPELIFVPNHFSRYSELSDQVMDIFHRYDPEMCPAGCDEGYLNITRYCEEHCLTAEECVQEMRDVVVRETNLTVSAGIAPNKMLAKICSDKNKPNGQFQLPFDSEHIKRFMHDLPIRKVPGVGRVNERLLDAIGIKTCGDIFTERAVLSLMDKQFSLEFMLRTYLGIASNIVKAHRREERKSIGAERTFAPLADLPKIYEKLEEVSAELENDMEETGWTGRTVTLKFKLDTYQVFTRAKSMDNWVSKKEDLFAIGKELLLPELPLKIRLIGLRVTKLKDLRDTASKGIKRFFGSAAKEAGSRKKVKLEDSEEIMDESMPGFHENDEVDDGDGENDGPFDADEFVDLTEIQEDACLVEPVVHQTRPPHSTTNAHASSSKFQSPKRPRRNSETIPSDFRPTKEAVLQKLETHLCPICGKTLETDNQGLNAHVDFCLSRGAIMEAQSAASKFSKDSSIYKGWPKPQSSKKMNPKPPPLLGKTKGGFQNASKRKRE